MSPEAAGEMGQVGVAHFHGNLGNISKVFFNEAGGPHQPDAADKITGAFTGEGNEPSEQLGAAHRHLIGEFFDPEG